MMTSRRTGTLLLALGLTLGLTACGGEEEPATTASTEAETTAEETTAEETAAATEEETTEETTEAETTEAEETTEAAAQTEEAEETTEAGGAAGSDELTEPGTELAVGDEAVIQLASLDDPEDDYYRYLKLRTTVTEITEADPGILDGVELATPIEDEVPYLIWADHEIIETDGAYEKLDLYPQLGAQHTDGSSSNTIWSDGAPIGECASEEFDSLEPGGTARTCVIALAEAGEQIGGVVWGGDDNADGGGDWEANPYYEHPVVWLAE